jgi:Flp pilus assembly protein protease CpaA
MSPFFPSPAFGWAFLSALGAILVAACYFDLRHLTIPNKLTVPALLAGFSANTIRGAWLGLENGSVWAGAVDGIWFALLGFLLGFVLFFVFWQMGICGGGDLKLFAAVASWLGWRCSFWVWLASFTLLAMILTTRSVIRYIYPNPQLDGANQTDLASAPPGKKRRGLLPYALPLTLSAVVVTLWFFRGELRLVDIVDRDRERAKVSARV